MANVPRPQANARVLKRTPPELLEMMGKFMVLGDELILIETENIRKPTHTTNALINFTTRYLHALSHGGNGVWGKMYNQYRRVAEAFLINSAPRIIVQVKDFDFANLKKFLMLLQSQGRLQDFQRNPATPATRYLEIRHYITNKCPKTDTKLRQFDKWVKANNNNHQLRTSHEVVSCTDIEAAQLYSSKCGSVPNDDTLERSKAIMAVRDYIDEVMAKEQYAINRECARDIQDMAGVGLNRPLGVADEDEDEDEDEDMSDGEWNSEDEEMEDGWEESEAEDGDDEMDGEGDRVVKVEGTAIKEEKTGVKEENLDD